MKLALDGSIKKLKEAQTAFNSTDDPCAKLAMVCLMKKTLEEDFVFLEEHIMPTVLDMVEESIG